MELLNSVVSSLIQPVASTITKHVVYPFKVGNNIRDLESIVRALEDSKKDLMVSIENAERQHGVPKESAKDWLRKVEKIKTEAEQIVADYRQRHQCLWNTDIWSNYKISKRAAKKQAELKNLCEQKPNLEAAITYMPPPLAQEMPACSSKSPYLQIALQYIKDDVHNIIGILGKGGIGKTHLLNQVNNDLCKNHAFDVVIFVTCSKDCYEEKVQDVIISKLGLNKNPELKQSTIYEFLKERSFVVLLDDLWNRVDLEKVGIPDPINTTGAFKQKVFLTTRSRDVCRCMEVQKYIEVDVLKWDQAWSLFVNKVTEETIKSHPLIPECAEKVAKELGGLPLALNTVGRAMRDKRNISDWEDALQKLNQAGLEDVTNESVFHTLSFSYENLKNNILKKCFLHCSLWPEDHCIRRDELVELWIGVGLIDASEIISAYNVGYNYIAKLQDVCLLEEAEVDDDKLGVKLHDVIHDMALWIANDWQPEKNKWIVQVGTKKDSKDINVLSETEKLSLMHNKSGEFSFSCTSGSPKVSTLLLNSNNLLRFNFLELFSGLIVLDLSRNCLNVFPIEICKLVNLQFLNLSCNCIRSLPEELAALINLRYLLLMNNYIGTIPYGILSKLKALRVLDMHFQGQWEGIDYSTLLGTRLDYSTIVSQVFEEVKSHTHTDFQALGTTITNMDEFEMLNENLTVAVKWLQVCICCEGQDSFTISESFLGNSQMQTNLFMLSITNNKAEYLNFESTPGSACRLGRLERLAFNSIGAKDILWKNLNPKDVLSRLQSLEFNDCNFLTSISWVVYLPCLEELRVNWCLRLKQLVDEEYAVKNYGQIDASYPTFPSLKRMVLGDLYELESICDPKITFPALETVQVILCKKLRKLPFNADNVPSKLRLIEGYTEWWDKIEWEDSSLKSSLQPLFSRKEKKR